MNPFYSFFLISLACQLQKTNIFDNLYLLEDGLRHCTCRFLLWAVFRLTIGKHLILRKVAPKCSFKAHLLTKLPQLKFFSKGRARSNVNGFSGDFHIKDSLVVLLFSVCNKHTIKEVSVLPFGAAIGGPATIYLAQTVIWGILFSAVIVFTLPDVCHHTL